MTAALLVAALGTPSAAWADSHDATPQPSASATPSSTAAPAEPTPGTTATSAPDVSGAPPSNAPTGRPEPTRAPDEPVATPDEPAQPVDCGMAPVVVDGPRPADGDGSTSSDGQGIAEGEPEPGSDPDRPEPAPEPKDEQPTSDEPRSDGAPTGGMNECIYALGGPLPEAAPVRGTDDHHRGGTGGGAGVGAGSGVLELPRTGAGETAAVALTGLGLLGAGAVMLRRVRPVA